MRIFSKTSSFTPASLHQRHQMHDLQWLLATARRVLLSLAFICFPGMILASGASEDLPEGSSVTTQTIQNREELRILLIGDSTVASYPKDNISRGWGQLFPEFFDDRVSFSNAAQNGRSSKSYLESGAWKKAMKFKPDFVFIQFGHNDQPNKGPERATDPQTTFRENLRSFIGDARKSGAQPILVTPVARRTFREGKLISNLHPWVEAMKAVGAEEKVPVIDLHGTSMALFEAAGEEGGADLNNGKPRDRTHFSEKGARAMAELVTEALPEAAPNLAAYLLAPETQPVTETR